MVRTFLAAALAVAAPIASADECASRSGPYVTPLVELYTSQGCSSCPPAERWLSGFRSSPPNAVVAIEFHVDYWDSLGWKDPLADARYTARQRAHIPANGAHYPYTPQVVVGGHDMPLWSDAGLFGAATARIGRMPALGSVSIAPRLAADGTVRAVVAATLDPRLDPRRHELVVVLAQNGLSTRVTAGENRGRELPQDFVARDMARVRLEERRTSRTFPLRTPKGSTAARLAVAAFIQDVATGRIVQALSQGVCE